MRAIPRASNRSSPPCPPTPAPLSGGWPRQRSRPTPSGSTAPPPHRAAPNSDHQARHRLFERPTGETDSKMNILKRGWIPLLIVVVVAIAGFTVYRMHGAFGSNNEITRAGAGLAGDAKPFNPKRVTYEIFGPAGAVATINYLDLDAQPQGGKDPPLPWSIAR